MTQGEKLIISSIVSKEAYHFLKMPTNWLEEEELALYTFCKGYLTDNSELPPLDIIEDRFGEYDKPTGTTKHYYAEVKDRYIYTQTVENIPRLMKDLKKNPAEVLTQLKEAISDINDVNEESTDVKINDGASNRFKAFKERKLTGGVTYMSYGDSLLDELFSGLKSTDLVTFGGFPGVGKTWWIVELALRMIEKLPKEMGPILFVTNEIGEEELLERMDAVMFKLNYATFIKGDLNRAETIRYRKGLEALEELDSRLIILDNCSTINEIEAKMKEYKPSAVCIDGSYLLERNRQGDDWKRIAYITRNLKGIAKSKKIPIIQTTQLKSKSGTSSTSGSVEAQGDFSYGASFVQDSDIAFRAYQDADMEFYSVVGMEVAKGRRVPPNTKIFWTRDVCQAIYKYEKTFKETDEEDTKIEY